LHGDWGVGALDKFTFDNFAFFLACNLSSQPDIDVLTDG
jgi:hypothetical protein